jgi:predicted glutamine amidotransferase
MCELMGLSFAKPIAADFSIRVFALRAAENADGWGLAWYPDRSLALVKEPLDWRTSAHSRFLET